jgi:hypothetical protein
MHIITPDPSAMVMIRAGHDAGVPVLYQELGLPYHPPDFASYYREFTTVLGLCSEVAALSPKLVEYCREKLPFPSRLSVLPIMSDENHQRQTVHRHNLMDKSTSGSRRAWKNSKAPSF